MIDFLRVNSHACYASSMSPPVVLQTLRSMQIIMGKDGTFEGTVSIQKFRFPCFCQPPKMLRGSHFTVVQYDYGKFGESTVPHNVLTYSKMRPSTFSRWPL